MKSMMSLLLLVIAAGCFLGATVLRAAPSSPTNVATKPTRVVLIGASIGQEWNLPELPNRTGISGYEFEALQVWQYDKTEKLDEVLMRPARKFRFAPSYFKSLLREAPKPADVVILKECSSYFPEDLQADRKRKLMEEWVQEVAERKLKVVIATVVPVTKTRAALNPGKQESVREYNDWVREYARSKGIVLLDLEAALRSDSRDRYLRDDLTSGDGSHLNRKAYDLLDAVMAQALCRLGAKSSDCPQMRALAK